MQRDGAPLDWDFELLVAPPEPPLPEPGPGRTAVPPPDARSLGEENEIIECEIVDSPFAGAGEEAEAAAGSHPAPAAADADADAGQRKLQRRASAAKRKGALNSAIVYEMQDEEDDYENDDDDDDDSDHSAAPVRSGNKRRTGAMKPTKEPEPRGEEAERKELEDLNERWKILTDAEKQIAHRTRMKWIAGRLAQRYGNAPTITSMLRHIGYPLGRRLTITQLENEIAEERDKEKDWHGALKGFLNNHINEKGKRQRHHRSGSKRAKKDGKSHKKTPTGSRKRVDSDPDVADPDAGGDLSPPLSANTKRRKAAASPSLGAAEGPTQSAAGDVASPVAGRAAAAPPVARKLRLEPKGDPDERKELEDLQAEWQFLSMSERASIHYARLKWVAMRLSAIFGTAVTAASLQPIGKSIALTLTLTQMTEGLVEQAKLHQEWKSVVSHFVRSQSGQEGGVKRVPTAVAQRQRHQPTPQPPHQLQQPAGAAAVAAAVGGADRSYNLQQSPPPMPMPAILPMVPDPLPLPSVFLKKEDLESPDLYAALHMTSHHGSNKRHSDSGDVDDHLLPDYDLNDFDLLHAHDPL